MSYRKEWKLCRSFFERVHCINMGYRKNQWYRICPHLEDKTCGMEIRELGSGRTRKDAWSEAASWAEKAKEFHMKRAQ